jgi:hypothetical protein
MGKAIFRPYFPRPRFAGPDRAFERYGDFSPTTHQLHLDIVVVYDMNDFSKGGEVRCPVAECSGFYSLDFDL